LVNVEDDLFIRGDEELLRVLLNNALANALKFSAAEVKVYARRAQSKVWIEVNDHGPGVPLAERAHVFSPFYRTKAALAGGVPGHGIGLALIAHVARIHSGEARFLEVDEGSRLQIELPLWTST
jgi:signal transduction histidine kinase